MVVLLICNQGMMVRIRLEAFWAGSIIGNAPDCRSGDFGHCGFKSYPSHFKLKRGLYLGTWSHTRCVKSGNSRENSPASGSWVPHIGRWWKGYHLVLIRLIFEFESRSSYFEKENSVRNPWVCLGEGYIPPTRERVGEIVDMFFLCMSPLRAKNQIKKKPT